MTPTLCTQCKDKLTTSYYRVCYYCKKANALKEPEPVFHASELNKWRGTDFSNKVYGE